MKKLCFLIVLLCSFKTFAQNVCPCFNISPAPVGCAPYAINVSDCSGGSVLYEYNNSGISSLTNYTFVSPGTFDVKQTGNFTCGDLSGNVSLIKTVTVKPTPEPKFTLFSCANNKAIVIATDLQYDEYIFTDAKSAVTTVKYGQKAILNLSDSPIRVKGSYTGASCGGSTELNISNSVTLPPVKITRLAARTDNSFDIEFTGQASEMYEVQMKSSASQAFTILDTFSITDTRLTIPGYNKDLVYCFRMRSVDRCGQTGSFSNEVCTITLKGTAITEANNLSWSSGNLFENVNLSINEQLSTVFKSGNDGYFSDTSIKCGNNYCYRLTGTTAESAVLASNLICLDAISKKKPPVLQSVSSTVTGNLIELAWRSPLSVVNTYSVFSSANGSPYVLTANTNGTNYSDVSKNPSINQVCYKLSYADNCGNSSDFSAVTCPVFLNGLIYDALSRKLFWKPYTGWETESKEYFVEKVDSKGNVYFSVSVGNALDYSDTGLDTLEQIVYFRIKVVTSTGRTSYSNIWEAVQKSNFVMPNAFTPNEDGLNDKFYAVGLFIVEFSMEIWNRNGEGVFATTNFREGWDGTIKGQPAPADTYMYKVEAADKLGNSYKRNGSLQLIK